MRACCPSWPGVNRLLNWANAATQWLSSKTRNMAKAGDREVTARVTAKQIKTPKDLVRRLAPRYEVIFDVTGTTLF